MPRKRPRPRGRATPAPHGTRSYRRKNGPQHQPRLAGSIERSRPRSPIWRGVVKTWKCQYYAATQLLNLHQPTHVLLLNVLLRCCLYRVGRINRWLYVDGLCFCHTGNTGTFVVLSGLRWHLPGLSELPLEQRLLLSLARKSLFPFFSFCFKRVAFFPHLIAFCVFFQYVMFVTCSSVFEHISLYKHFEKNAKEVDTGRPSGHFGRGLGSIRAPRSAWQALIVFSGGSVYEHFPRFLREA